MSLRTGIMREPDSHSGKSEPPFTLCALEKTTPLLVLVGYSLSQEFTQFVHSDFHAALSHTFDEPLHHFMQLVFVPQIQLAVTFSGETEQACAGRLHRLSTQESREVGVRTPRRSQSGAGVVLCMYPDEHRLVRADFIYRGAKVDRP